jgi:Na+/H+ antiporter NhaA
MNEATLPQSAEIPREIRPLFIGTLAFDDDSLLTQIRVGVLVASLAAAAVAALVLRLAARR